MTASETTDTRLPPLSAEKSAVDPAQLTLPAEGIVAVSPSAALSSPLLSRLLKIAHGYRKEHSLRQAIEIYFELVEDSPRTPEALAAREALLQIGEGYERSGELRQARAVYERLFQRGVS